MKSVKCHSEMLSRGIGITKSVLRSLQVRSYELKVHFEFFKFMLQFHQDSFDFFGCFLEFKPPKSDPLDLKINV